MSKSLHVEKSQSREAWSVQNIWSFFKWYCSRFEKFAMEVKLSIVPMGQLNSARGIASGIRTLITLRPGRATYNCRGDIILCVSSPKDFNVYSRRWYWWLHDCAVAQHRRCWISSNLQIIALSNEFSLGRAGGAFAFHVQSASMGRG